MRIAQLIVQLPLLHKKPALAAGKQRLQRGGTVGQKQDLLVRAKHAARLRQIQPCRCNKRRILGQIGQAAHHLIALVKIRLPLAHHHTGHIKGGEKCGALGFQMVQRNLQRAVGLLQKRKRLAVALAQIAFLIQCAQREIKSRKDHGHKRQQQQQAAPQNAPHRLAGKQRIGKSFLKARQNGHKAFALLGMKTNSELSRDRYMNLFYNIGC